MVAPLTDSRREVSTKPVRLSRRPLVQSAVGHFARAAAWSVRGLGPRAGGGLASAVARGLGRFAPEQALARANLAAAFPEKSEAERRAILSGVWDNLARTVAELPTLRRLVLKDPDDPRHGLTDRVEIVGGEWISRLRDDGVTGIAFTAHLGNWELLGPFLATYGGRLATLYRTPRNPMIAADLARWRGDFLDLVESGPGAAMNVANRMRHGEHFAMLSDQRLNGGPEVPFFGRRAPTNPIVARLARQFDCPVVGCRVVRLPESRFRVEVTPPLDLPRDADGRIAVVEATAMITEVIEGWVRDHPEQWLWLHDRWGDKATRRG